METCLSVSVYMPVWMHLVCLLSVLWDWYWSNRLRRKKKDEKGGVTECGVGWYIRLVNKSWAASPIVMYNYQDSTCVMGPFAILSVRSGKRRGGEIHLELYDSSTVKCHLSGRHLSEHVGYPTVGSTKYVWLPDIQNLIVVPLTTHTRYLPVEYIYMDHTISSDLRCNETCMRQGSLLPTAQNM